MSRLRSLTNHLAAGTYTCHVRVEFASAREQQTFLQRDRPADTHGWTIAVSSPPRRGYDGTPIYRTDIWLATPYPRAATRTDADQTDDQQERCHEEPTTYGLNPAQRDGLSWTEQQTFQYETTALLQEMGVTDLGWRRGR